MQLGDAGWLQARLQKIFEKFFAEEIEAVAADSAQDGVQQARGEDAIGQRRETGGAMASTPMVPRRAQRSRKLCAFQVKKPTGRTAVRLSRLPSTRQKTGSREGAESSRHVELRNWVDGIRRASLGESAELYRKI